MRHLIKHTTRYHYTAPVSYSIQLLRLTPRQDEHQRLLRWHIDAPGLLEEQVDAYGNITHTLTLTQPHDAIELKVTGQIDVTPLHDGQSRYEVPVRLALPDESQSRIDDLLKLTVTAPDGSSVQLAELVSVEMLPRDRPVYPRRCPPGVWMRSRPRHPRL